MKKARIAVLVSGGGTNLQALIDAQASGIISSGEITLVIPEKAGGCILKKIPVSELEDFISGAWDK